MRTSVLGYIAIATAFGILTEVAAWRLRFWVYAQSQTAVLNVIVMFGLVMGGLAALVPRYGVLAGFAAGGVLGLLYELANLRLLHWWDFPNQRLLFLRGHAAILVALTLAWALLPPLTAVVHVAVPHLLRRAAPRQSPLETLNAKEKALMEKLDGLRQREREIGARLEYLRARKRALSEMQNVRPLVLPPLPTPTS